MSSEGVTYSALRFHKSSPEPQTTVRPGSTQQHAQVEDKEHSVPWKLIAVAFGILCLLLLVAITVLVTIIFQCSQEKHQLQEIRENCANYTVQNDSKHDRKCEKDPSSLSSCRCFRKNMDVSNSLQNEDKHFERLFCCGVKCYYFTRKAEQWRRCRDICEMSSLSLVKIDDNDELTLLQAQVNPSIIWTGLSYDARRNKWTWADNSLSSLNLTAITLHGGSGKCSFLSATRMEVTECSRIFHCVCEKRMDQSTPVH